MYVPPDATGVLLLGHGGGRSKDSARFVQIARSYAAQTGLAVVCIDAIDHGERRRENAASDIPRLWHSSSIERMVEGWSVAADELSAIGPARAYVGFSMGSIFGLPTVAAIPSITAAVFVVGGIPDNAEIDDPPLAMVLQEAASRLQHANVLMANMTNDKFFPISGVHSLFAAIRASSKRLMFWEGEHDDWPSELLDHSGWFVKEHGLVARATGTAR